MDPVRVAFDVGPLHGRRTGVGAAVAELGRALAVRVDVDVIPYLVSARARVSPPARRAPVPAALAHRLWARFEWPRLDRWLRPAGVIHGTNYVVAPSRLPAVVSVYDTWFLDHAAHAAPAVRRAGEVLRRRVAAGAWVHASSAATAQRVGELLGTERVVTVTLGPLPPPVAATEGPTRVTRPFVLALGTEERRKNYPGLVDAFNRAGPAWSDLTLVVAGSAGDDTQAINAAIDALAPETRARVVRLGRVDEATKGWLLRSATVLAYPSFDEGFGFPVLEAQAAGLPVVATAVGSIPEVAGTGAHLVPLGDLDALAEALTTVATDDDRRTDLIKAGRANVGRFSWTRAAEAMTEVYRSLAAGDDPRPPSHGGGTTTEPVHGARQ